MEILPFSQYCGFRQLALMPMQPFHYSAHWVSIASTVTAADGSYTYDWTVPASMANGHYVIKAEFLGDSNYLSSSAATESGSDLLVLPEYSLCALAAILTSFGALLLFKMRGKIPHLTRTPYP